MIFRICAYKDIELDKYLPPFVVPSPEEDIIEGITEAGKKGKIDDCAHKMVYFLGTFDTADGKFKIAESPFLLVDCRQFVKESV